MEISICKLPLPFAVEKTLSNDDREYKKFITTLNFRVTFLCAPQGDLPDIDVSKVMSSSP